jgi:DNA-binding NarL/FixJ family response regulator
VAHLALPVPAEEQSVLLIEADPDVQVKMARTLRQQGYRVVATSSSGGALALVSEWNVDLILVSEHVAGVPGVEVARRIHRAHPRSRVVVVSSQIEPELFAAARAAGALGCVPNSLDAESLIPWLPPPNSELPAHEAVAE